MGFEGLAQVLHHLALPGCQVPQFRWILHQVEELRSSTVYQVPTTVDGGVQLTPTEA